MGNRSTHHFKGNLLFADGHTEQLNGPGLDRISGSAGMAGDLFLASVLIGFIGILLRARSQSGR